MNERQKRMLIIASVIILALILWLIGKRKETVIQTPNGPVVFGNVDIPAVNFPPRNAGDGIVIPGLNIGQGFGYGGSTCMCDGGMTTTPPPPPTNVVTMAANAPVSVDLTANTAFYGAGAYGNASGVSNVLF